LAPKASFGRKYDGDAKTHISARWEAHIGCHPQDVHLHTSKLTSGRLLVQQTVADVVVHTHSWWNDELANVILFVATLTAAKCHINLRSCRNKVATNTGMKLR
jgi:hypothetical protein